jgi:hypothetical protein
VLFEGERLKTVTELSQYLETIGRKATRQVIYNWIKDGMESGHFGRTVVTSVEAFWRYVNRPQPRRGALRPPSAEDLAQTAKAANELEKSGW